MVRQRFRAIIVALFLVAFSVVAKAEQPAARIIGGDNAPNQQWPWMTQLSTFEDGSNQFFVCGGSRLSPRWVLTAAHCVRDSQNRPVAARNVFTLSGQTRFGQPQRDGVQAQQILEHPCFQRSVCGGTTNDRSFNRDLALIRTPAVSSATFPNIVDAAELNALERAPVSDREDAVTVLGWGETESGQLPSRLQQASMDFVPRNLCRTLSGFTITEFMTCALKSGPNATPPPRDTCFGDSGGPLFVGTDRAPPLLGITSFGTAECASGEPSVFTDVLAELATIEALTHQGGAPLVDLRLTPTADTTTRYVLPGDTMRFEVLLDNNSRSNRVSDATVSHQLLTADLSPTSEAQGTLSDSSMICSSTSCRVSSLSAGDQRQLDYALAAHGLHDRELVVQLLASSREDDYRQHNNRLRQPVIVSDKPHLSLSACSQGQTLSNGQARSRLTVTVNNLSTVAASSGATVVFSLPTGTRLANDNGQCRDGNPTRCALGDIDAEQSRQLVVDIDANSISPRRMTLTVNGDNGSFPTDQLSSEVTLRFSGTMCASPSPAIPQRESRSGGPWPALFLLALLALRRQESHSGKR